VPADLNPSPSSRARASGNSPSPWTHRRIPRWTPSRSGSASSTLAASP